MAYYLHVVRMHPERVAGKVIRQMALFYLGEKHYFITSPRAELGAGYTQTVDALRMPAARAPSYPAFDHYFERCETLSSTHETISQPLTIRGLGGLLSVLYPVVFFCALGAVFLLRSDLRKLYGKLGAMMLLVFSYNFGNCLVAAIAHSLSNTRYIVAQYSFSLLAECMGLLFLVEVAMETRRRRRAPTKERST